MNTGLAIIGMGIVCIAAGVGIGIIGSSATTAVARQPEAKGSIMQFMILSAALIEGLCWFAIILAFILAK